MAETVSSQNQIGSVQDSMVTHRLAATVEAFDLWVRAQEVRTVLADKKEWYEHKELVDDRNMGLGILAISRYFSKLRLKAEANRLERWSESIMPLDDADYLD